MSPLSSANAVRSGERQTSLVAACGATIADSALHNATAKGAAAGIAQVHAVIVPAVAAGELLPAEAATVAGIVEARRKALETQELERRIAALETE